MGERGVDTQLDWEGTCRLHKYPSLTWRVNHLQRTTNYRPVAFWDQELCYLLLGGVPIANLYGEHQEGGEQH